MMVLVLNYVVLRALWKIDVYLISTLVNKSLYYYYMESVTDLITCIPLSLTKVSTYHYINQ